MPSVAIEAHELTVSYHTAKPVIWNIDFAVPSGKIIGIIGPNGAGKSTLLKAIMGLVPISSGWVKIFDHPLAAVRNQVSYVPQRESVDWDFPANVLDVVLTGRYPARGLFNRITRTDREIALSCIEKVNLTPYINRQISQLSGGQQQRVFIARSLAQQANLYLMDEPFAGVDANSEDQILQLLQTMRNEGKTIVVVHHDLQTAQAYFDWFLMLNTRLVAAGPTNEVFTDESLQKTYGGKLSLLTKIGNLVVQENYPIREK